MKKGIKYFKFIFNIMIPFFHCQEKNLTGCGGGIK